MKPLLLAVASAVAFLPLARAEEGKKEEEKKEEKKKVLRHLNQEKTFSAVFPPDFKVDALSSARIGGSRLRGVRGELMVTILEESGQNAELEAYATRRLDRCLKGLKDCKVEEKNGSKIAGCEARVHVLSWVGTPGAPEKPMKMLLCLFVGAGRGYEVACFAPAEAFADSRKAFEMIAESVRLAEPPKTP